MNSAGLSPRSGAPEPSVFRRRIASLQHHGLREERGRGMVWRNPWRLSPEGPPHVSSIQAGRPQASLLSNPYLLLTTTMLFWAGNSIAGRLAVDEISPMSLTTLRWIFVGAAMFVLYRRALLAHWGVLRRHKTLLIFMGATGFTAYNALFYWA